MPKFRIRLESQTDAQWREVTLSADDEKAAREAVKAKEEEIVAYTLEDDPYLDDDLRKEIKANYTVSPEGKAQYKGQGTGSAQLRGKAHMAQQAKPYKIKSVEEV
jgi:hypothetical protein